MTFFEIILLAASLSIDSFAVSMSGAVSLGVVRLPKAVKVALTLALIQTAFLSGGYYAGDVVGRWVESYGSYIGFAILMLVGFNMIKGAGGKAEEDAPRDFSGFFKIVLSAVATSIDALALGASFGLSDVSSRDLLLTAAATFVATVLFSIGGIYGGSAVGHRFGRPAGIVAGVVLMAIGVNILL